MKSKTEVYFFNVWEDIATSIKMLAYMYLVFYYFTVSLPDELWVPNSGFWVKVCLQINANKNKN